MKAHTMNRHTLTYITLHPEPVKEPSRFAIYAGSATLMLAVYVTLVFAFGA